jgi:uncharacterized protein involved in exopolysaccharide biosynthesis
VNREPIVQPAPSDEADVLDIAELLRSLLRGLWLLPVFLALGLGLAAAYLHTATYRYAASLQITSVEGGGASLPSGVAGLGSLVGFDIGLSDGSDFELVPEALVSKGVASRLAQDEQLMRAIFPYEWDAAAGVWRAPESLLVDAIEGLKSVLGVPRTPWAPPGAVRLRDHLQKTLEITPDRKKDIITIRYQHEDPAVAEKLVGAIVAATDDFLRAASLAQSDAYVSYLEARLQETTVAEYRLFLAQALVSYENKRMMAMASTAYAARPFGPVLVSERPASPKPVVVLAASLAFSLILWAASVLLRGALRRRRVDAAASA